MLVDKRMIHLDTNFLIQSLLPGTRSAVQLQTWVSNGEELGISTIAWSEFLCGPLKPSDSVLAQTFLSPPESLLTQDAEKAAELFNATGRRSRSLADCQIAAVALRCGAKLATVNNSDFAVFKNHGLILL